jgi:DHA3 family macrolide efflux protein-like MFS transporter
LPANWKANMALIWSGQAVSFLTTYAASFAAMWHIAATTGSALWLAWAGVAALAPTALLSPIGGLAADRFDRKRQMITADAVVGALSLGLAAAVHWSDAPMGVLLVFLAARGAAQAFHSPAMSAALPALAPESQLVRVNALSQSLVGLAGIVGPALGILLYQAVGFAGVLLGDALGAGMACLTLARARVPRSGERRPASPGREFADGLRALAADRPLAALVGFCGLVMLIATPAGSLFPLMVYQVFDGGGYHASLVEALWSLGAIVGSVALAAGGGGKRPVRLAVVATIVLGGAQAVCGLLHGSQFVLFSVLTSVMAVAIGLFSAPIAATMQRRVAPELLGRVTGLFQTVITLAAPLGLVFAGFGADRIGLGAWLFVSGLAVVAVALAALLWPRLRSLDDSSDSVADDPPPGSPTAPSEGKPQPSGSPRRT